MLGSSYIVVFKPLRHISCPKRPLTCHMIPSEGGAQHMLGVVCCQVTCKQKCDETDLESKHVQISSKTGLSQTQLSSRCQQSQHSIADNHQHPLAVHHIVISMHNLLTAGSRAGSSYNMHVAIMSVLYGWPIATCTVSGGPGRSPFMQLDFSDSPATVHVTRRGKLGFTSSLYKQ